MLDPVSTCEVRPEPTGAQNLLRIIMGHKLHVVVHNSQLQPWVDHTPVHLHRATDVHSKVPASPRRKSFVFRNPVKNRKYRT
jgi:hypothetical protein